MKKFSVIGLLLLVPVLARAEILTLYSDRGAMGDNVAACNHSPVCAWPSTTTGAAFDGNSTLMTPPEGFTTFRTSYAGSAGWGVFFDTVTLHPGGLDLSRFRGGQIRFWLYIQTVNAFSPVVQISLEHVAVAKSNINLSSIPLNQWVPETITISPVSTAVLGLYSPFEITALSGTTFYVDNVRYVTADVAADVSAPYVTLALNNQADGASAAQLSWSSATLPSGWVRADQYVQLVIDSTTTAWGAQLYTDNMGSGASPAFTGNPNQTDPSGLVDTQATASVLPLAWSIQTTTAAPPAAGDPDVNLAWLYVKDKSSPGFANGSIGNGLSAYATVQNNQGIQYVPGSFGAIQAPPNYLYFEANFSNATGGHPYKTTTLLLEYFYP